MVEASRHGTAERRAAELRRMLHEHAHRYYVLHEPSIPDGEYDQLFLQLRALEEKYPHLVTRDSPTQRLGSDLSRDFAKARHERPILSLANAFGEEGVRAWQERNRRLEPDVPLRYVVEPKFDGLTIVLRYEHGVLVRAATRGNGEIGDDVTTNARTVRTIPLRIPVTGSGTVPPVLVVRGEVLFEKEAFQVLNQARLSAGLPQYVNARNTASGSLKQKDAAKTAKRNLMAYAYDIVYAEGPTANSRFAVLDYLGRLGFSTPPFVEACGALEDALRRAAWWAAKRDSLDFEIDGVVIKVDDLAVSARLGVVGKDPRGAIAYKFPSAEATTTLLEIIPQVGRTGRITPTAVLEAVFVGGVTVTHASLHNYDQIAAMDVRLGDTVVVKRSGDVIPYIKGPVQGARTGSECVVSPPVRCPVSGDRLLREEGTVDLFCPNAACSERIFRSVAYFASRAGMDIEGLGPQTLRQLIAEGLIRDAADLFSLRAKDLELLEGFGQKKAGGVVASIDAARTQSLERLLVSLGIPGVGTSVASLVTQAFMSLAEIGAMAKAVRGLEEEIAALLPESRERALDLALRYAGSANPWKNIQRAIGPGYASLAAEEQVLLQRHYSGIMDLAAPLYGLEGVGSTLVRQMVDWFTKESNGLLLRRLAAAGLRPEHSNQSSGRFDGLTFVITGTLPTLSREAAKAYILRRGGRVAGSVSRKTDFVVVGQKSGSKAARALDLGIRLLSEQELRSLAEAAKV